MLSTLAFAQNKRLSNEIKDNMLKAYDYRSDIDKKILAETKKWPNKYGILHNDWIENKNGKSITLTGETILPQYDYTELDLYCDSLYMMKVGTRRGVVTSSGRMVVPFKYWTLSFKCIDDGLILGLQNSAGTGKVDIYSINGHLICELNNIQSVDAAYYRHDNVIEVIYRQNNEPDEKETLYFPDGTLVTSNNQDDGGNHPSIPISYWFENNEIDDAAFQNNIWVQMFWEFYNNKRYRDALYCISFFDSHERQTLCSDASLPNFITFTSILDCYKKLGMHEELVRVVKGTTIEHRPPRGLIFNLDTHQVESELDLLYSGIGHDYLMGMINDVNELYNSSLEGYRASVEQRQQNAQMWVSVMSATVAITTATLTKLAEEDSKRHSSAAKGKGGGGSKAGPKGKSPASGGGDDDGEIEQGEKKPRDTSRIDRKIQELEEKIASAEAYHSKNPSGTSAAHIMSLKDNLKDLKKYRQEILKD